MVALARARATSRRGDEPQGAAGVGLLGLTGCHRKAKSRAGRSVADRRRKTMTRFADGFMNSVSQRLQVTQ